MESVVRDTASDIVNAFVATSADPRLSCAPMLVGIAGAPGSGKTTFAAALGHLLNDRRSREELQNESNVVGTRSRSRSGKTTPDASEFNCSMGLHGPRPADVHVGRCFVMGMDGYHLTRAQLDQMPNAAEAHRRRGAPWTFDADAFATDLDTLKSTGLLEAPSFDHAAKDPVPGAIHIDARTQTTPFFSDVSGEPLGVETTRSIVIVEGLYVCLSDPPAWRRANALFDLLIYVDCDLELSTERLTRRHMAAWGIPREAAFERANGSDRENAVLVKHSADNAHIVVDTLEDAELAKDPSVVVSRARRRSSSVKDSSSHI